MQQVTEESFQLFKRFYRDLLKSFSEKKSFIDKPEYKEFFDNKKFIQYLEYAAEQTKTGKHEELPWAGGS